MAKRLMNLVALILLGWLLGTGSAQATPPNRAGLVVVHGNGQIVSRCIEFTETQLSGLDLLTRSGLDLNVDATNAIGVAVCRIDKEGCTFPNQPCFCQCQGSPCIYWSYWRLTGGTWKYSSVGASSSVIRNGDVDGWVWGIGTVSGATPPPAVTFDQICAPSTATRTATATNPPPTHTPVPPTHTPLRPTATTTPPTRSALSPTRLPTTSPTQPTSTSIKPIHPSTPLIQRALPSPTVIGITTPTLPTTRVAISIPTLSLPTETSAAEREDVPSAETSDDPRAKLGDAWRWVRIILAGGAFCGATLVTFGVTLAAIKRLA